jgi:NAD(P)H-hydrate epimerase
VKNLGSPISADLVIDALFGGRASRGLPDAVHDWMDTPAPVVAVDFPTGLDPDTGAVESRAFSAVETVTFGCVKTGHVQGVGPDLCGLLTVADIGITGGDPSMFLAEESDAPRPPRRRKTHKWDAGAVLVVGGSTGMIGACTLAGKAALAFGAGSVHLATPQPALAQEIAPELPCHDLESAVEIAGRFDVVVAGPGLAASDVERATSIMIQAERVVLDAGGIAREMIEAGRQNAGEVVITPHDAEFAGLAGVGAGAYSIRSLAKRAHVTVLRKGNPTMITDGGLPILVTSGGPELASMGTGDVLAGMISALWARGLTGREAAVSGAYWHGVAGSELARNRSLTADGLVDLIGRYAW